MALNFAEQLSRFIQPVLNKINSLAVCATIVSVNDKKNLQTVKVNINKNEVRDGVERIQQFGFTSNPPDDSEAILIHIGGVRSHAVVISSDNSRYRIKELEKGAVALYNQNGDKVILKKDAIEIVSSNITIGKSNFKKLINEEFIDIFNNHVHNFTAAPSGAFSTSTPAVTIPPVPPIPGPPPVGGVLAPFILNIGSNQTTKSTKAE